MKYTIKNDYLCIEVQEKGAELSRIQSLVTGIDYLWNGDPAVWASTSPVLFPVIGAIKNGFVKYKGQEFAVPRHGMVRNNEKVTLIEQSSESLTFGLDFDEASLKIFPFEFQFRITYQLAEKRLFVKHHIANLGTDEMLFSLGGHPAFKCPLHEGESYEDYYLEFEAVENKVTWLLSKDGLVLNDTKPLLDNTNVLHLDHHLFDNDALILKHLVSEQVSLRSTKSGQVLTIRFEDFPYLGIWAKPEGDFVCIEPWLGIADSADSDQNFETKEGILKLNAGATFDAQYSIEIQE